MSQRFSEGGAPRTANQEALERYRAEFAKDATHGRALLDLFERSGARVWLLRRDRTSKTPFWWLHVTLAKSQAETFDLNLEILVVYAEFERIEPRLLTSIRDRLESNARLEPGIAVVASRDPDVAQLANNRQHQMSIVPIRLDQLTDDTRDLRERLGEVVATVDHYDATTPVRDPSSFFGRVRELDEIGKALNQGQSIGIFGLRKAGKSSLMNVLAIRRKSAGVAVAQLDISSVESSDMFRIRVLEGIWTAVSESSGSVEGGRMPHLRLLTSAGKERFDTRDVGRFWIADLKKLLATSTSRVELFIDEIDQALSSRSILGEDEADRVFRSLVQLRGVIQETYDDDARLSLVCAGVNPSLFERAVIGGRDNLLYKLVQLFWLAPLERDEMANMVRALGKRMAVRIRDHEVIDTLYGEYGGHPLLSRKACSLAVRKRDPELLPFHLTLEKVREVAAARGIGSPAEQARDVFSSFEEWFPREAEIVGALWSSDPGMRDVAQAEIAEDPHCIQHAVAYGLVDEHGVGRLSAVERAVSGEL